MGSIFCFLEHTLRNNWNRNTIVGTHLMQKWDQRLVLEHMVKQQCPIISATVTSVDCYNTLLRNNFHYHIRATMV